MAAASVVHKWYTELCFLIKFRICFYGKCAASSDVKIHVTGNIKFIHFKDVRPHSTVDRYQHLTHMCCLQNVGTVGCFGEPESASRVNGEFVFIRSNVDMVMEDWVGVYSAF